MNLSEIHKNKIKKPVEKKEKRKMAFQMNENETKVYCDGGMSAEIAFTKYYAHRIKKVYAGWNISIRMVYPEIILHSLHNVVNTVKITESEGCQKVVLHSPGFLSVPYMTELCNFVYLPSQFLVGFEKISDLKAVLAKLKENGIKAYAVAGYDGCISHCLVAWIKFLEMPPCYSELLKFLQTGDVILSGVYESSGKSTGENVIFQYEKSSENIEEGDVYFLHINACYKERSLEKDWEIFSRLCSDFKTASVQKDKKSRRVGDWESGFDMMQYSYILSFSGRINFLYAKDTKALYDLSFSLSKFFLEINRIPVKGVVLNPYIMNSPTYETHYGYISYCYWAGSSYVDQDVFLKCDKDMKIWFNDQNGQKASLKKELQEKGYVVIYINNTSPLCEELSKWILTYKPREYPRRDFVSVKQLQKLCCALGINFS